MLWLSFCWVNCFKSIFVAFTEHAFHSAYYKIVYTEHFFALSRPAKVLTMFHNGYEFVHHNERITMICMIGYTKGCKAKVRNIHIGIEIEIESIYNYYYYYYSINSWTNRIVMDKLSSHSSRTMMRSHTTMEHTQTTGITIYRCLQNKQRKCKARSFHKIIRGIDYLKTDEASLHKSCPIPNWCAFDVWFDV